MRLRFLFKYTQLAILKKAFVLIIFFPSLEFRGLFLTLNHNPRWRLLPYRLTQTIKDFDDTDGVFVSFVYSGAVAKLRDPSSGRVIGAPAVQDLPHHLPEVPGHSEV